MGLGSGLGSGLWERVRVGARVRARIRVRVRVRVRPHLVEEYARHKDKLHSEQSQEGETVVLGALEGRVR